MDAIRGRETDEEAAPATTELGDRDALAGELAGLRARGELVLYGDGCRVRLLDLPSLEWTGDEHGACRLRGAESPDGSLVARCLGERIDLFATRENRLLNTLPGCAPSWRPDGTLTATRERAVVRFHADCHVQPDCTRVLISRPELVRAARRHPTVPARPTRLRVLVDGIAWLSQSRAAVLLSIRLGGRLAGIGALSEIAFFENGRLAATQPYFRITGGRIAPSPRGTYVTQQPDVILRRDGTQVNLPQHLRDVRAFAWSPDERFLALATRFAVVVLEVASLERYDETGGGLRSVTLPVSARELAWR